MHEDIPNGYILTNKVVHSRFLPSAASHAFTYPTIAFLVSLNALESNKLDLSRGWLFGYGGLWGRLTGIRPSAYLHDHDFTLAGQELQRNIGDMKMLGRGPSIAQKLRAVLLRYGHNPLELDDAWMLTMPSYLGFEGINPLTVYYCYRRDDPNLWIVVLEVHNTFGERHVYVLRTGRESEEEDVPPGFTHSWLFPRQFHVSPFNDRSGYYKCSIVEPWKHPVSPSSMLEDDNDRSPGSSFKYPSVQIHLYTTQPTRLKLTALLRPTSVISLNSRNLLSTLLTFPLTLFLSFPRIAYEAYRLHYDKQLDVYARPEPRAVEESVEKAFSSDKNLEPRNPVQDGVGHNLGRGGGVGWQPEGILERYCRLVTEDVLDHQAQARWIHVTLVSSNPALGQRHFLPHNVNADEKSIKYLTLTYHTSRFFLVLLSSPSPQHALLVARAEGLCIVSDENLFVQVFTGHPTGKPSGLSGWLCHLAQRIRLRPIPVSLHPPSFPFISSGAHPLDLPYQSASTSSTISILRPLCSLLIIITTLLLTRLEQTIFFVFHARFVPGDEPWLAWSRAANIWLKEKGEIDEGQDPYTNHGGVDRVGSILRS